MAPHNSPEGYVASLAHPQLPTIAPARRAGGRADAARRRARARPRRPGISSTRPHPPAGARPRYPARAGGGAGGSPEPTRGGRRRRRCHRSIGIPPGAQPATGAGGPRRTVSPLAITSSADGVQDDGAGRSVSHLAIVATSAPRPEGWTKVARGLAGVITIAEIRNPIPCKGALEFWRAPARASCGGAASLRAEPGGDPASWGPSGGLARWARFGRVAAFRPRLTGGPAARRLRDFLCVSAPAPTPRTRPPRAWDAVALLVAPSLPVGYSLSVESHGVGVGSCSPEGRRAIIGVATTPRRRGPSHSTIPRAASARPAQTRILGPRW